MNKFFVSGKHKDGSEVCASITNLNDFIKASPDDFIVVMCDDAYRSVKKGDIEWQDIKVNITL